MCLLHPSFIIFILAVLIAILHLLRKLTVTDNKIIRPLALQSTIFVPFVAPPYFNGSQINMINTRIEHIFKTAAVPSRIFLGIYDCQDKIRISSDIQKNVKIMKHMDLKFPFRESNARAILCSQLYDQEKFTFLVPFDVELTFNWDDTLIQNQELEDTRSGDRLSIITSMCKLSKILESSAPDFLCLQEIRGARLSLCTKQTVQPSEQSTPSLFWSPNYSFCHGDVFEQVPLLKDISDSMETTLNCVRLWTNGYRFVVPKYVVASTRNVFQPKQTTYTPPKTKLGTARSMTEFEMYTGISFKTSTATPRARAGLSPKARVGECTCKYGSIELARLQMFGD